MHERIKVAVIGTGYLGSLHAKTYKDIPGCSLEAVCDINKERAEKLSAELGVPCCLDYRQLFHKVDAVSIATPTNTHFNVACDFLKTGINTLVEKPFTKTIKEADTLIRLAEKNSLILQVGHIERFNSVFLPTKRIIKSPKFIECHRLSPFPNRSLDVGAVLDIMIHDIDIILGLVSSRIKKIESLGINVLTPFEDIANARIQFANGCVANLTASRVSDEVMRKIRIFQEGAYISLDYRNAQASVYRKSENRITKEDLPIEKEQPLKKELESFIECVKTKEEPLVNGRTAREALAVALKIQEQIWRKTNIS